MKKPIILFLITGTIAFNFCTSEKTAETNTVKEAALMIDTAHNIKIGKDFLAPPDSEYTGDYFKKYDNGVIEVKGYFRFGRKHGKWMYFYKNGLLWSEAFFDNDKKDGDANVYHENGKLYYSGHYQQDVAVGTWNFYDSTGKLAVTKKYDSLPVPKK